MDNPLDRLQIETGAIAWHKWRFGAVFLLVIAGMLTGCASTGGMTAEQSAAAKAAATQQMVTDRAEARWQALIKGDLDTAYGYLSTGSKAATPLDAYKRKTGGLRWRRAEVQKVDCDGEICKVTLDLTYDMDKMKGIKTPIYESWIIENGSAGFIYG
jgi:hypothetical protein